MATGAAERVEFGVFEWNAGGVYRRESAVKVCESQRAADRHADAINAKPLPSGHRGYVVRTLGPGIAHGGSVVISTPDPWSASFCSAAF